MIDLSTARIIAKIRIDLINMLIKTLNMRRKINKYLKEIEDEKDKC